MLQNISSNAMNEQVFFTLRGRNVVVAILPVDLSNDEFALILIAGDACWTRAMV